MNWIKLLAEAARCSRAELKRLQDEATFELFMWHDWEEQVAMQAQLTAV